jgi:kynurenine formamidase
VRRIIDLTLTLEAGMRGVRMAPAKTLEKDGWNARTLELYSHCGTHMDAPRHFLPDGETIDRQPLEACTGPARVLDLTPVKPRELITLEKIAPWRGKIVAGDRLLLRTDWSRRHGTPAWRDELPRLDLELARWLVGRGVKLVGVEPPSVADVNNRDELTAVHQVLLAGGVTIIEGLTGLDRIPTGTVELVALPLKVLEGDGAPARVIAIVES